MDPKRCTSFAPSITKPATESEYMTMPVAIVVGGTSKLATMPASETGSAATLKDISTWPSAIAIIGTQDSRVSSLPLMEPSFPSMSVQATGAEAKRFSPSRSDRNRVTSCPRTLLPAASSGGEKTPSPPLPGAMVTMPPATPLLPGRPIS